MPRPVRRPRKAGTAEPASTSSVGAPSSANANANAGQAVQSSDGLLLAPAFAESPVRPRTDHGGNDEAAQPRAALKARTFGDGYDDFGFFAVADVVPRRVSPPTAASGAEKGRRATRSSLRAADSMPTTSSPRADIRLYSDDPENSVDGDDSALSNETLRAEPSPERQQRRAPLAAKTDDLRNQLPKRPTATAAASKAKANAKAKGGRKRKSTDAQDTRRSRPTRTAGGSAVARRGAVAESESEASDENDDDDDDSEVEEIVLDLPAEAKARLAAVRRQFEQVDKVELEYESLSSNFYSDE